MSELKDRAGQAMNDIIKKLNAYVDEAHSNEEIRKGMQESINFRIQIIDEYMKCSEVDEGSHKPQETRGN